jgi:hypothetical protein
MATEELEVTGALRVTVSGTVLGTSSVGGLRADTTVLGHGDEVQSGVETALDGGQIHVEGELVADEVEGLVAGLVLEEVHTGTDVGAVLVLGHELEVKSVTAGGGTVGALVVDTLDSAVLSAVLVAGADAGPLVAVIAVLATDCFNASATEFFAPFLLPRFHSVPL